MGRKRIPNGADEIYRRHLAHTPFAQNPRRDRQARIQRMYEVKLTELAMNRFKWEGLPDEIDVRFMEMTLFYTAISIFYWDKDFDKYFAVRGGSYGPLNMLDQPTELQTVGNNYISRRVPAYSSVLDATGKGKELELGVPVWANYLRIPDIDIVEIYASKLSEIDRTLEINSKNARQTKFVAAGENSKLSLVNINRQMDEGQDYIQVGGMYADGVPITAIDLGIDKELLASLRNERNQAWNDCMSLLGIDNTNQDKKERLVVAETTGNQDSISNMRYVNLNARRIAAEQINDAYGLNVTVEYWTDEERSVTTDTDSESDDMEDLD